jgi:DUF4097 and DUF4098 domain-containing protein YvlB/uncharacterized protein YxeA
MRKIIVIGVILFIIGLAGASIMVYNKTALETATPFKQEKKTDGTNVKQVKVTSDAVDLEIYPSPNNQITATFTGTKQKNMTTDLQLKTTKDSVEIRATLDEWKKRQWIHLNFGIEQQPTKVAVYLPKKQYEALELNTSNGDIQVKDYQGNTVTATTNNGDIKLQNTKSVIHLQSQHGDISLEQIPSFAENNTITTSSGDIHVKSTVTPTQKSTAQLSLKTNFGDISLDGYQGKQLTAVTSNGDINVSNIDSVFTINSSNGDVKLNAITDFYARNQVETSNGDINVSVGHDPKSLNVSLSGSEVQSDFPIGGVSPDGNQKLQGVIGTNAANAPVLNMQTSHGDIHLTR